MNSGKFVLRIPGSLHTDLKQEAFQLGISLNEFIVRKLLNKSADPYRAIKRVWGNDLLGIVLFGSSVRGETRASSDIDLLIVLDERVPIRRILYAIWDEKIMPIMGSSFSPQFSHLTGSENSVSSLWLEVALEGQIEFDPRGSVRKNLFKIKERIASGEYRRKLSHGHPYWVREKNAK